MSPDHESASWSPAASMVTKHPQRLLGFCAREATTTRQGKTMAASSSPRARASAGGTGASARCSTTRAKLWPCTTRATAAGGEVSSGNQSANHDRKSVVYGTSVSVRVDLGGRRVIRKTKIVNKMHNTLNLGH